MFIKIITWSTLQVVVLCSLVVTRGHGQRRQPYYCTECSNGFFTLTLTHDQPDTADSYFRGSGDRALFDALIPSTQSLTYIYTLALNGSCSETSGAIMAVQYCHQRTAVHMLSNLTLLSFTRSNGQTLITNSTYRFMLPTDQPCAQSGPYCCRKLIATDPHFLIRPTGRFIFGVSVGTGVTPLAYNTSTPNNYTGIQYHGQTTRAEHLLLLRFWIGNY